MLYATYINAWSNEAIYITQSLATFKCIKPGTSFTFRLKKEEGKGMNVFDVQCLSFEY